MDKFLKSVTLEIQLTATTGKFYFPNDNRLNQKRIVALSIPQNDNDNLKAPSGRASVDNACINATYISIVRDSDNLTDTLPANHFQESSGDRSMRMLNYDRFNPGKSYVEVLAGGASTESIVVIVYYED
jgi:hypothetical protein